MFYKLLQIRKDRKGRVYFTEEDLPYDRQDDGEYTRGGCHAYIYQESDSRHWKSVLLKEQKDWLQDRIDYFTKALNYLEGLKY